MMDKGNSMQLVKSNFHIAKSQKLRGSSSATTIMTLGIAMLAACASQTGSPARGQEIRVRYAEVTDIERVKLPSAAPTGAVVGGFTGLLLARKQSTGRQLASGIGGAALGGLATAALEGDRLGYSYRLRYPDGGTSNFITEKGYLQRGDCVAVERGEYANIRRVANVLCTEGSTVATEPTHIRDAQQCQAAKDQLLEATSEEAVAIASRKVSIICEY